MKRTAAIIGALLLPLAAYLNLWPMPIKPQRWAAPTAPGYGGPHVVNTKLAGLTMISLGAEEGPEHAVIARVGRRYSLVANGNFLRTNPDGSAPEVLANSGGCPVLA